jgi:uncharacterized protein (TIGR03067 family)
LHDNLDTFGDGQWLQTWRAIYDLHGDTWRLCWNETGGARPAAFPDKEVRGRTLLVLKRVAPGVWLLAPSRGPFGGIPGFPFPGGGGPVGGFRGGGRDPWEGVKPAGDQADDRAKELARLEGAWQIVGLEVGAKAVQYAAGEGGSFTFTRGGFHSKLLGFGEATGKVVLGPQRQPRGIDLVSKGGVLHGAYRLAGNTLTLALWAKASERQHVLDPGKQRPPGMTFTLRPAPKQTGNLGTGG